MGEAIFGLIGVVIGGLLTGVVQLYVEHVRNKRTLRIASRLLLEHWVAVATWIRKAHAERPEELRRIPIDTTVWERYQELLTAHLSYSDWALISYAAAQERAALLFPLEDAAELEAEEVKDLLDLADELEDAAARLRPLAK